MPLLDYLVGSLRSLARLLYRPFLPLSAFLSRYIMPGLWQSPTSGLPGTLLDTDLYKVGPQVILIKIKHLLISLISS